MPQIWPLNWLLILLLTLAMLVSFTIMNYFCASSMICHTYNNLSKKSLNWMW